MKKFLFLAGLVIGVFLGSKLGRGPYESLERTARQVASDPEVQRRAEQAKETAGRAAQDAAETVKAKAPEVASAVQSAVAQAKDSAVSAAEQARASAAAATDGFAGTEGENPAAGGTAEVGDDKPLSS